MLCVQYVELAYLAYKGYWMYSVIFGLLAVVALAAIGSAKMKQHRSLAGLVQQQGIVPIVQGGWVRAIPSYRLVPGDIIVLQQGRPTCDMVLLQGSCLVSEAMISGEVAYAVLCCSALCCAVLQCAVLCCAVLQCATLCCAVLQCALLCCAAVRYAVLCCSALCCAVLLCAMLAYHAPTGCCQSHGVAAQSHALFCVFVVAPASSCSLLHSFRFHALHAFTQRMSDEANVYVCLCCPRNTSCLPLCRCTLYCCQLTSAALLSPLNEVFSRKRNE